MDEFITINPIFNSKMQVQAYQLNHSMNSTKSNTDYSSSAVIDSFFTHNIASIVGNKMVFMNFSDKLISYEMATLFPNTRLVVEVFNEMIVNDDMIEKSKALKEKGYIISIDNFGLKEQYIPLIKYATYLRVDFKTTEESVRNQIVKEYAWTGLKFIAGNVETQNDFLLAKLYGYNLVQGSFVMKPEILPVTDVPPLKFSYIQLIKNCNEMPVDFDLIAKVITRDVSLSYKLLKLVNSPAFGFIVKTDSVKKALIGLGEVKLKKWISLIVMKGLVEDQSQETLRLALVRAKFMENIGEMTHLKSRVDDLFLTGLFSLLDVLMNRPLNDLLMDIPLSKDITDVLLEAKGEFKDVFYLVKLYEVAEWDYIGGYIENLNLDKSDVTKAFFKACSWCNQMTEA